jgi:hypothetical protein
MEQIEQDNAINRMLCILEQSIRIHKQQQQQIEILTRAHNALIESLSEDRAGSGLNFGAIERAKRDVAELQRLFEQEPPPDEEGKNNNT